ncbi:MAG TPA: sigma 54-interacting transcriptional regulator [Terriglobales bacterium]|jgi:two-component system response regulator AtoC|nr:sigma 54-interacting transcriptional regulator [Terriglobales bacterium]
MGFPFLEAVSPIMKGMEAVIKELAHNCVPVLLIGEAGTGKRTIAKRIYNGFGKSTGEFRMLRCSDMSVASLASHLQPRQVTVYLDEVSDLNAECQQFLMEFLSNTAPSGGRVIGGSARDLERELRAGAFREELYYRLSGVCLRIPPLRQRKEDIPALMSFFLARYAEVFHREAPSLSAATRQLFLDYSWPGNLKELEAAARAIVAVGDESVAMDGLRSMLVRPDNGSNGHRVSLKEAARAASREAEKELILKALTRTRWNRRRAAQELQISYKALLYKLKQIGFGECEAS